MALETNVKSVSKIAAADLSAKQFYAVVFDTNGKAALQTSAGGRVDGVNYSKSPAGNTSEIAVDGEVRMLCGAALTAGDSVEIDATGRAITHVSGKAFGVALLTTTGPGLFTIVSLRLVG